ncbi:rhodanese-like domain-containing protein 4A, chloroplastic [Diospyros lotus]|uniref:rhodanese-like domain-containing protein 4A, chloroplastic n=1 Tax=Diospyros lotus TaxID=55363 RepID=UPI002251D6BC|nr:rhodanese-like domain-containing protein 4A, chloroplastic [Diospyros lotus]
MESLSVGLSSSPFQSPDAKNHRPTLKPIHQFRQNYYSISNSFSYFQTQIISRKKTTCSPLTQSSIHLSNTPSSTYFSNLPKTHFPSLKNNHSFLQSRLKSHLFFLCSGLAFPLCCFASEIVVPTEEVPSKINLEAVLVSIDDFFNRNPFFVAGVTFIWLVVIPLTQEFLQKYKFISAINAFRKLRDDPSTQLLDIRDKKSLQYLGSPNLRILSKSVVQVEYREGDDEGFVTKVLDELAEPESTAICVIDNFDGNSMKVAELLFKHSFKEAYAIRGGVRGKNGWQAIQENLLPPSVHIYPKRKVKMSEQPEINGGVNDQINNQAASSTTLSTGPEVDIG